MAIIITGAYGAGKTEFCAHYSLNLAKEGPVKLADMDIYNPYFRSREKADFFAAHGVEIIGSNLRAEGNQDVPAISGEVLRSILKKDSLVVDLAGSFQGLKVLNFFKAQLKEHEFWVVFNPFREECSTPVKMLKFMEEIKAVSGLKLTGIVHNSHMLRETVPEHILYGQNMAREISEKSKVPIKLTFLNTALNKAVKERLISHALTFDRLIMREDWQ